MRNVLVVFLVTVVCLVSATKSVDFNERNDVSKIDHGARIDASMDLLYDTFKHDNDLYLYGGRGLDASGTEVFMDLNGEVWNTRVIPVRKDEEGDYWNDYVWTPLKADTFGLIDDGCNGSLPDMRYGHSTVLCPTSNAAVPWNATPSADRMNEGNNNVNLIVFGGKKQIDSTDNTVGANESNAEVCNELWVFSKYEIRNKAGKLKKRYHWTKLTPLLSETWPPARAYAQVVPLFNEQTPLNERTQFLLFGGQAADGSILDDVYLCTFSRDMTYPAGDDNEWTFTLGLDVTFQELSTDDVPELFGASVVYDPYYGYVDQDLGIRPRVIVTCGTKIGSPDYEAENKVIVMYPSKVTSEWDWGHMVVKDTVLPDVASAQARTHHQTVLNIRNHTLRIFGGETVAGQAMSNVLELDMTDANAVWKDIGTVPEVTTSRFNAVFSESTVVYRRSGSSPNFTSKIYYDDDEITFLEDTGKTWNVSKTALWGLDNPESIVNTPRLQSNDTIRIHQTRSETGKINDAYKCNLSFPGRVSDITVEGVMKNGIKPVLYQLYNPDAWGLINLENEEVDIKFHRAMSDIFYVHCSLTVRNLHFCHFEDDVTYNDTFPQSIPAQPLGAYQELNSQGQWDFLSYHSRDPGIFVHAPIAVENCKFSLNGVGIVFICVSSAISQAELSQCDFDRNFFGIVSLETAHLFHNNRFTDNYMAGIAIDKGARATIRDNLFIDNCQNWTPANSRVSENMAAIMSCFASPYDVPTIQHPLLINNTFIDNLRALAVTEPVSRHQVYNRPVFCNNIVSSTDDSAIRIENGTNRCNLIAWNNCFDVPTPIFETDQSGYEPMILANLFADPDVTGSEYLLNDTSSCIDQGLYLTDPGVTSEMNYLDYGRMDSGYHFPSDQVTPPDPPRNLDFSSATLSWNHPIGDTPSYLILVELPSGELMDFHWTSSTQYTLPSGLQTLNLWCGVMSHDNQTTFSDPVWIEYQ